MFFLQLCIEACLSFKNVELVFLPRHYKLSKPQIRYGNDVAMSLYAIRVLVNIVVL